MDKSHYLAKKSKIKQIHIPDWDEDGFIRVMTGQERAGWFSSVQADDTAIVAKLVCLCLADDQGGRIFADEDLEAVKGLSGIALDAIFKASLEWNLLTKDSVASEKKD